MRNRARPATIFSLMGIASRIAERIGLHRDGDMLGLQVMRSEERRRIWWQLQYMEISVGQLLGSFSMIVFADWDSKFPANLEDYDFHPDMQVLPLNRRGLTGMSHCLWRYQILYSQRVVPEPKVKKNILVWLLSPQITLADKDEEINEIENLLGEKYLQYCEPLNPLHVHIQIRIRSFILAARRTARQPALVNAKISEMSIQEREDYLGICKSSLDYYILSQKTESLKGFQWHNEDHFQWPACE
jgi:Fungal specific transcription factor domain